MLRFRSAHLVCVALTILSTILYVKFVEQKFNTHSHMSFNELYERIIKNDCVSPDVFASSAHEMGWDFSEVNDDDFWWPVHIDRSEIGSAFFLETGNEVHTKHGGFWFWFDGNRCLVDLNGD